MAAPFAYLLVQRHAGLFIGGETAAGTLPSARLPALWTDLLYRPAGKAPKKRRVDGLSPLVVAGFKPVGRNPAPLGGGLLYPGCRRRADPLFGRRRALLPDFGRSFLPDPPDHGIPGAGGDALFGAMVPFPADDPDRPAGSKDLFTPKF